MTVDQQALLELTRARAAMIIDQPFFGTLALRLKLVEDNTISSLAVDGKHVFYNAKFVRDLTPALRKSAMAHEVGHCVFDHLTRRNGRNPSKWNAAGDYVINDVIKDAGFELGKTWLHNPAFKGMTADHIYSLLPDQPDDEHGGLCDIRDAAQGNPADAEMVETEWKIATAQAAQAAKAQGKLSGSLERFVDDMLNSKVDWKAMLRQFITSFAKNDYQWTRPNRRMLANGFYLPGLHSEVMESVCVVTDDSGSIDGPVLSAFTAEISAIRDAVRPVKTIHISCDARINHMDEFSMEDEFKLVSKGGGGTDFRPPFTHFDELGETPKCLIYLTDGYGPFPQTAPDYPVLWVMTTDVVPPWGQHVRIEI